MINHHAKELCVCGYCERVVCGYNTFSFFRTPNNLIRLYPRTIPRSSSEFARTSNIVLLVVCDKWFILICHQNYMGEAINQYSNSSRRAHITHASHDNSNNPTSQVISKHPTPPPNIHILSRSGHVYNDSTDVNPLHWTFTFRSPHSPSLTDHVCVNVCVSTHVCFQLRIMSPPHWCGVPTLMGCDVSDVFLCFCSPKRDWIRNMSH